MCLSMDSKNIFFILVFCPSQLSSLSALSPYLLHFLPIQHNIEHNLIIWKQTHSRPTPQELIYSCSRLPIYHFGDEPKPLKQKSFLALNQHCSICHSRISRTRIRKSRRDSEIMFKWGWQRQRGRESSPNIYIYAHTYIYIYICFLQTSMRRPLNSLNTERPRKCVYGGLRAGLVQYRHILLYDPGQDI